MLFVVGLLRHALFATTSNPLVIRPFSYTASVMNHFALNLDLPDAIGHDPAWPAFGWARACAAPTAPPWLARRRS